MDVTLLRADALGRSVGGGVDVVHALSFGSYYDPTNLRFGALVAHNDDLLAPHAGYDLHAHAGVTIATVVVDGSLTVASPGQGEVTLTAGGAAVLGAGPRTEHAERAGAAGCRYVQVWIAGDEPAAPLASRPHAFARRGREPYLIAGEAGPLRLPHAALFVLPGGARCPLPSAGARHVAAIGPVTLTVPPAVDDPDDEDARFLIAADSGERFDLADRDTLRVVGDGRVDVSVPDDSLAVVVTLARADSAANAALSDGHASGEQR